MPLPSIKMSSLCLHTMCSTTEPCSLPNRRPFIHTPKTQKGQMQVKMVKSRIRLCLSRWVLQVAFKLCYGEPWGVLEVYLAFLKEKIGNVQQVSQRESFSIPLPLLYRCLGHIFSSCRRTVDPFRLRQHLRWGTSSPETKCGAVNGPIPGPDSASLSAF